LSGLGTDVIDAVADRISDDRWSNADLCSSWSDSFNRVTANSNPSKSALSSSLISSGSFFPPFLFFFLSSSLPSLEPEGTTIASLSASFFSSIARRADNEFSDVETGLQRDLPCGVRRAKEATLDGSPWYGSSFVQEDHLTSFAHTRGLRYLNS
jgi:hypothetical protein